MMKYYYINGNPWMELRPDCVIRSLSIGLNMSYVKICKILGVNYRIGYGLVGEEGAASFEQVVDKFSKYLKGYELDELYSTEVFGSGASRSRHQDLGFDADVESGFTIEEYCDMVPHGLYLFCVRPTKEEKAAGLDWHMTLVNTKKKVIIDAVDCRKSLVYGYAQIKIAEMLKPEDKDSRFRELIDLDYPRSWNSPNKVPEALEPLFSVSEWKELYKKNTRIPHLYETLLDTYRLRDYFFRHYLETISNSRLKESTQMKTKKYTIKNYRGNIVESIRNFQDKISGFRIVEAVEKDGSLKVTAVAVDEDSRLDPSRTIYRHGREDEESPYLYCISLDDAPYGRGKEMFDVKYSKQKGIEFIDPESSEDDAGKYHITHPYETKFSGKIHQLALDCIDLIEKNKKKWPESGWKDLYVTIREIRTHKTYQAKHGKRAKDTPKPIAGWDGSRWAAPGNNNINLTELLGKPEPYAMDSASNVTFTAAVSRISKHLEKRIEFLEGTRGQTKKSDIPELDNKIDQLRKTIEILKAGKKVKPEDRIDFPSWAMSTAKEGVKSSVKDNEQKLSTMFNL